MTHHVIQFARFVMAALVMTALAFVPISASVAAPSPAYRAADTGSIGIRFHPELAQVQSPFLGSITCAHLVHFIAQAAHFRNTVKPEQLPKLSWRIPT